MVFVHICKYVILLRVLTPKNFVSQRNAPRAKLGMDMRGPRSHGHVFDLSSGCDADRKPCSNAPNVMYKLWFQYGPVWNTSWCSVCLWKMSADVKPSFKYDVVNSTHPRVRSLNNLSCRLIRDLLQARLENSIFSRLLRMTMLPMLLFLSPHLSSRSCFPCG